MEHQTSEFAERPVLEYPYGKRWSPQPGEPYEVADGVFWLRMPLPIALDHINLWILRDGDGWTLVDTGYDATVCQEVWEQVFRDFLSPATVKQIVVTHFHPDHIGLASWLAHRCDCPILISKGEFALYHTIITRDSARFGDEVNAFLCELGYAPEMRDKLAKFFIIDDKPVESRVQESMCRFIADGDRLVIDGNEWQVVSGNGHSPEHACLYNHADGVLISGDQSIPRISSNVSVYPSNRHQDPLGDWIASCEKLRDRISADTLVLPAHQEPFRGNPARMQQLIDDHHAQLNRLRLAVKAPISPVQARKALFNRELNTIETLLATGETLAHLNYLLHRNEIKMQINRDGVAVYWSTR